MTDQNHGLVIATPYDMELEQFGASLIRRQANRCKLLVWIRENLIEGTDFGKIHVVGKTKCNLGKACKTDWHFSKPVLFKPGAEKICGMLGVIPRYPNLPEYERAALQGIELKVIVLHCELQNSVGYVLADGVGARSLQSDSGDWNKSLKMAEKAAMIDATLRLAAISEWFTQDLDDTPPSEVSSEPVYLVTGTQLKKLQARLTGYDLPLERVLKWCKAKWGIEKIEELTYEQFQELDAKLEKFAETVVSERGQEPISPDQLRKVMSFALQHTVDLTQVLRKVGVNKIGELTYDSLGALWKALEATAERKAIQREGVPVIAIPPGSEAERLMEKAQQIRTDAQYADGANYYKDLEEAQNLEAAARKLLQEAKQEAVS